MVETVKKRYKWTNEGQKRRTKRTGSGERHVIKLIKRWQTFKEERTLKMTGERIRLLKLRMKEKQYRKKEMKNKER